MYSPLRSRMGQRDQIAQTMMNISSPEPQVQGGAGLPPGMHMAPTPLKRLMGIEPGMSPGFMGGQPAPMPGMQQSQQPPMQPPPDMSNPITPQTPQTLPPQNPSALFAAPPAVPGQAPPQFAKPPTY